jgi:hypothetical protein
MPSKGRLSGIITASDILILVLLWFAHMATIAKADVYDYHPASGMRLGGGYDSARPTEPYVRKCMDYSDVTNIDSTGGVASATYTLQVIANRQELYKSMHISASADASFGFFSSSGSIDAQDAFSSSSDSITWTAQAQLTFGRFQPVDPKPIDAIAKMTAGDIRSVCGTELVTQETRGVVATIMYTFRNLSTDQKNTLATAISASASFFSGGGSANAAYQQALEQASQSSELSITVTVRGGPGKDFLASSIGADSDLTKIRAALQSYIAASTEANAAAFQYGTSSTSQFYPNVGNPELTSARDDALVSMYSTYKDLSDVVDRIQALTIVPVKPEDQYLNTFVSQSTRSELGRLGTLYAGEMSQIRTQATKCLTSDASCHPFDISALPRVNWPQIPQIPDLIVQRVCVTPEFANHQPTAGQVIATIDWTVLVEGNSQLLDRVLMITGDNGTPVNVTPFHAATVINPRLQADFAALAAGFDSRCTEFNPDTSHAFGQFVTSMTERKGVPLSIKFELHDRLGRISYLHPPTQ